MGEWKGKGEGLEERWCGSANQWKRLKKGCALSNCCVPMGHAAKLRAEHERGRLGSCTAYQLHHCAVPSGCGAVACLLEAVDLPCRTMLCLLCLLCSLMPWPRPSPHRGRSAGRTHRRWPRSAAQSCPQGSAWSPAKVAERRDSGMSAAEILSARFCLVTTRKCMQ